MVVALCAASPVTAFADNWPTAAKSAPVAKPEPKPEAEEGRQERAEGRRHPLRKPRSRQQRTKAEAAPVAVKAVAPVALAPVIQPRVESSVRTEGAHRARRAPVGRNRGVDEASRRVRRAESRTCRRSRDASRIGASTPAAAPAAAAAAQTTAPRPAHRARAPRRAAAATSAGATCSSSTSGSGIAIIDNSAGIRTNIRGRPDTEFKGRVRSSISAGHYALNAGVFSGASNTSSWNNTGMGTGVPARDLHLKQLYLRPRLSIGLEFQYGGIYVVRGEGTEITTYDNDCYLTGQRVTVKRPKQLWFDEISATQAYLGDGQDARHVGPLSAAGRAELLPVPAWQEGRQAAGCFRRLHRGRGCADVARARSRSRRRR